MGMPISLDDIQAIAANAWDELGIPPGSSSDRIVTIYREICLKRSLGMEVDREFYKKAVAYRFLNSIPLAKKEYHAADILPLLNSLDATGEDDDPSRSIRACAMLDISISCMERAQSPWHLPYVNYVINVHYCMRRHVVRRRYTEFVALHEALSKKLPVIPNLPEKSWRYKLSMPSDRARDLVLYLSRIIQLLSHRKLFSTDIMAFLEIDHCKVRSEEEGLSADCLNRIAPVLEGSVIYVINSSWLMKWRNFVLDVEGMFPPGPISNEDLLDEHGEPIQHMFVPQHYRFLSPPAYKFFYLIYRGGPDITRKTKNIYTPRVLSPDMASLKIQTLIRGYLARMHAKNRRESMGLQRPEMERSFEAMEKLQLTEKKMHHIRTLLEMKIAQNRHSAAIQIQKAYRRYKYRIIHADDIPVKVETDKRPDTKPDYFTLDEIGMIEDDASKFIQFIHTMQKGIAILKLSSRFKPNPKSKFFKLDRIGSQLMWTCKAKPLPKSVVLAKCTRITIESPVQMKSILGYHMKQNIEHGVVLAYPEKEIVLIAESQRACDALYFGLKVLIKEGQATLKAPNKFDEDGVIRRQLVHAKDVIRQALAVHEDVDAECLTCYLLPDTMETPKCGWHWQVTRRRTIADVQNLNCSSLRKLQNSASYEDWLQRKKRPKAEVVVDEMKDVALSEERFLEWLKSKSKHQLKKTDDKTMATSYPPFKAHIQTQDARKEKPAKTMDKNVLKCVAAQPKTSTAYEAWLEKKNKEARVVKRKARKEKREEVSNRQRQHIDKWRKKTVVLAYTGLYSPSR